MTGVRSFDVKAYDNSLGGYGDLGWGDDVLGYPLSTNQNPNTANPPFLLGTPNTGLTGNPGFNQFPPYLIIQRELLRPDQSDVRARRADAALVEDNRLDAQFPNPTYQNSTTFSQQYPNSPIRPRTSPTTFRTTRATSATTTRRCRRAGCGGSGTPGRPNTAGAGDRGLLQSGNPKPADAIRGLPVGTAVHAADLSVVSAALPGALARDPDPDPGRRPQQPTD